MWMKFPQMHRFQYKERKDDIANHVRHHLGEQNALVGLATFCLLSANRLLNTVQPLPIQRGFTIPALPEVSSGFGSTIAFSRTLFAIIGIYRKALKRSFPTLRVAPDRGEMS
jgi:hypothetical protein